MVKANRPDAPPLDKASDAGPRPAPKEYRTGPEIIADYVKNLSQGPGVYRMYGEDGEVLYVGKAKKLKNRVSNYAKSGGHTNRIALMISLTRSMEFVLTRTETEALLLEANLIKRLKPRFNILLRDDKSFPYILIRRDHESAQLTKHRGARKAKGDYFGPFASPSAVNNTLNTLQKAFGIRTCTDSVYEGRTRPCMLYQIKRCAGPCVDLVSPADYDELVREAKDFLSGRSNSLRQRLQDEMTAASENLDFETAAKLRDRIRAIAAVTSQQDVNPDGVEDADVIALHQEGGKTCVQIFFFRAGQNWGNRALYPKHEQDAAPDEILSAFIAQFYDDKPAPRLILTSSDPQQAELLAEALTLRAGHPVEIRTPKRGSKKALVEAAERNAKEALGRNLAESRSQAQLLDGVARVFGLEERPERIEVYDNSHIQGTNALGAMIVAGPEGFDKQSYRRFNMKGDDAATNDDFAMMQAMIRRRFTRLQKEREDGVPVPDLILIDGGKGQLSSVMEVMEELGVDDVAVAAVAKGPDRDAGREVFYMPGKPPIRLPMNDPVLYYLQRIRDEAHRFAITGHRAKRAKQIRENPLDEIDGVGATRKSALLKHFGSAKAVSRANLADLEAVEGVSRALARKIYEHFHE
ncbi:MAG: excinuclease ABC subunit C [Oceanicaulis sp.]|uniref:excinuclease ABC subunit UvrC n=1 Tax=unclassified Oceanicaulis TaxID=2632123 RepID=UPI000C6772CD|nr:MULTISPECIES: excinuclease ABC subunit UvrC [unclassified Oceanicaulis]MAB70194.1 excinuclease ABC subunit C [Oceanicaulis sp.]MBC39177.1 excinuclease ABC subunit C [Oceanicaulis sp.]MBG34848.1 excinuclease ABC subunit C [Oceanicaulis sp.]HBU62876.1 excinuclease ABC subunit C [Oceanicaulis sp.]HCR94133.1 excinuclease ABC subunit C [Oceanicaulis sp.]|tara:strand:- start:103 stop:2013 length:1911 start_codon:yes stop_codon:yes gene_type:complete